MQAAFSIPASTTLEGFVISIDVRPRATQEARPAKPALDSPLARHYATRRVTRRVGLIIASSPTPRIGDLQLAFKTGFVGRLPLDFDSLPEPRVARPCHRPFLTRA
jgi:hypothetical protein